MVQLPTLTKESMQNGLQVNTVPRHATFPVNTKALDFDSLEVEKSTTLRVTNVPEFILPRTQLLSGFVALRS